MKNNIISNVSSASNCNVLTLSTNSSSSCFGTVTTALSTLSIKTDEIVQQTDEGKTHLTLDSKDVNDSIEDEVESEDVLKM